MRGRKLLKIIIPFLCGVLLLGAGIGVGWKIADKKSYNQRHQYPLLDPSVTNPDLHQEIINFDPLRQNVKKYLAGLNLSHSLYFEYLPNGVSIRDGDDNTSQAASLIKTPNVMSIYKLSEQGKVNLDSPVTVTEKDINNDPDWGNPTSLRPGQTITLRQAAKDTLKYSGNTTLNVIKNQEIPLLDSTNDSFRSLDVSYTVGGVANNEHILISARSYSSVLKCLYYACFNTPKDSTEIINSLIGSSEPDRIVAGVNPGIKVAHKVGSGGGGNQSDCGIIYYPGKPYVLCLMFFTIPADTDTTLYFQHISREIYQYVSSSSGEAR